MRSHNTKIDNNLKKLYNAFLENDKLSISDICTLLSCNRQSAYNYIKRLNNAECSLNKITEKKTVYYTISNTNENNELNYLPVTYNIIRKERILHALEQSPVSKENFRNIFCLSSDCESDDSSKITLDIGKSQFYALIKELISFGDVVIENDIYYPTGNNIPISINLKADDLDELYYNLNTLSPSNPYHEEINSLLDKISKLTGYSNDLNETNNYLTYDKKAFSLEKCDSLFKKISQCDYDKFAVKLNTCNKTFKNSKFNFLTGMAVFSVENESLYLVGENIDDNNKRIYIDVDDILSIENTSIPNNIFHSDIYKDIFNSMFTISAEAPVPVKVRFDNKFNIYKKIQRLHILRKNSKIEPKNISKSDKYFYYTDTVSGLDDFASFIMTYGKSASIISPPELKEIVDASVRQTLSRYEELENE